MSGQGMSKWLQLVLTTTTTGELYHRLLILVNKYQENDKRNKRNKEYLRHYLTGNQGNALVYPYKPLNAYIHRGIGESS